MQIESDTSYKSIKICLTLILLEELNFSGNKQSEAAATYILNPHNIIIVLVQIDKSKRVILIKFYSRNES